MASEDRRLRIDDERVCLVLLADLPPLTNRILTTLYAREGWRVVTTPYTNPEILRQARKACSGRECLPFLSMMGKALVHLNDRPRREVTALHLLYQEGPCQIGNWYDATPTMLERLAYNDVVPIWPVANSERTGGWISLQLGFLGAIVVGDLMDEVRTTLRCLAAEPDAALTILDDLERDIVAASGCGIWELERELQRVARHLRRIPLRAPIEESPRVLLFGGINRVFVDKPVRQFFDARGILAKAGDVSEFLAVGSLEAMVRVGFARGRIRIGEQCSLAAIVGDLLAERERSRSLQDLVARGSSLVIDKLQDRWRTIMARSGLLFEPVIPFSTIVRVGEDFISWNGFSPESPGIVGRYFGSLRVGAFDGYVNLGAFNCAPSNTAAAAIAAPSRWSDAPYVCIEAEGSLLTHGQIRLLETVAAQSQRRRAETLSTGGHHPLPVGAAADSQY